MDPLTLGDLERAILQDLVFRKTPARALCRAQALLWIADGESVDAVAQTLGVSLQTVYNWIHRFEQRKDLDLIARVSDAPRSGRPPIALGIIDPLIQAVIKKDPRKWGYHYTTWTAPVLKHFLREQYDIDVSLASVKLAISRLPIHWKRPRHVLALQAETWRQSKGGSKEA